MKRFDLVLDGRNGLQCIFTRAHHNHATRCLPLAIQLANTAPHLGAQLYACHIAQAYRYASVGGGEWNFFEIIKAVQVARSAHHIFSLPQFQHGTPRFLVGFLQRFNHAGMRDVVGSQLVRVKHHLVLAHHAAYRGNLRNVGHGFKFVL